MSEKISEAFKRVEEPQPSPEVDYEERETAELKPGGPIQTPPAPEVHYGFRQNLPAGPGIQEAPSPGVDYSEMDPNVENAADDAAERAKRVVHAHGGDIVPPEYPKESRGMYQGDMPQTAKPGPEPNKDNEEVARHRAAAETVQQPQNYPKEARGVDQGHMPQTEQPATDSKRQSPAPDPNPQRTGQPPPRR